MDRLADELLALLFSHVELDTLLTCVTVCATWQRILCDARYWTRWSLDGWQARYLILIYGQDHVPRYHLHLNTSFAESPLDMVNHAINLTVDCETWTLDTILPQLKPCLEGLFWRGLSWEPPTVEPVFPQLKHVEIEWDEWDEEGGRVPKRSPMIRWESQWIGRQPLLRTVRVNSFHVSLLQQPRPVWNHLNTLELTKVDRETLFHLLSGAADTLENVTLDEIVTFRDDIGQLPDILLTTDELLRALLPCRQLQQFSLIDSLALGTDHALTFQSFPHLVELNIALNMAHPNPCAFLPIHATELDVDDVLGNCQQLFQLLASFKGSKLYIREHGHTLLPIEEKTLRNHLESKKWQFYFYQADDQVEDPGYELNITRMLDE